MKKQPKKPAAKKPERPYLTIEEVEAFRAAVWGILKRNPSAQHAVITIRRDRDDDGLKPSTLELTMHFLVNGVYVITTDHYGYRGVKNVTAGDPGGPSRCQMP